MLLLKKHKYRSIRIMTTEETDLKHTIYTKNEQVKVELTTALRNTVKKAIIAALDYQEIDFPVEISVTFTDNEKIHALNKEYSSLFSLV